MQSRPLPPELVQHRDYTDFLSQQIDTALTKRDTLMQVWHGVSFFTNPSRFHPVLVFHLCSHAVGVGVGVGACIQQKRRLLTEVCALESLRAPQMAAVSVSRDQAGAVRQQLAKMRVLLETLTKVFLAVNSKSDTVYSSMS
jgi:hypothetical protein